MKSTGKSRKTTTRSAAAPEKRTPATRKPAAPRSGARKSAASVTNGNGPAPQPRPDAIAARAYELFARSGYRHGRDLDHWLEAERELMRAK